MATASDFFRAPRSSAPVINVVVWLALIAPPAAIATAVSKPNPWYPDHAVFSATKDELKAMPEFKYST